MWAGLFPCRRTWVSRTDLKSWSRMRHEEMIFSIVAGGVMEPVKAPWRISESVSKSTSCIPTSHAKSIPSSMAFASASNGPSGTRIFLLMAATHWPLWSLAMTPVPTAWRSWKMAPSTLTLYLGLCVGVRGGVRNFGLRGQVVMLVYYLRQTSTHTYKLIY